jgi:hypothetical protein
MGATREDSLGSKVHITAPHQQQPVHLRERTSIFEEKVEFQ